MIKEINENLEILMSDKINHPLAPSTIPLNRVRAKKDFTTFNGVEIKKGQLGGYVWEGDALKFLHPDSWIDENSILDLDNVNIFNDYYFDCSSFVSKINDTIKIYLENSKMTDIKIFLNSELVICNSELTGTDFAGKVELKNVITDVEGLFLTQGTLEGDPFNNIENLIYCSLGIKPDENGFYTVYKWVYRTPYPNIFRSAHDSNFLYTLGKEVAAKNPDEDKGVSCAPGLHVSVQSYNFHGNVQIKCKVHIDDVITCMYGKLRVRKLKVIEVVDA